MRGFDHLMQPFARNMGVDLRRCDIGMAEQRLHGPEVGAAFHEMGCEGVPHDVR